MPAKYPIGAVLVHNDADLARSGNHTIRDMIRLQMPNRCVARSRANSRQLSPCQHHTLCHARALRDVRRSEIIQARVPRLVYGADDPKVARSAPASNFCRATN